MSKNTNKVVLHEVPPSTWAQAEQRAQSMRRLLSYPKLSRALVEQEAQRLGISYPLVYKLLKRYETSSTVSCMLPHKRGNRKNSTYLPLEVEELITQTIDDFYLNQQKVTLRHLQTELLRRSREKGLSWIPHLSTIKRRLNRIDPCQVLRSREGKKAAEDRYRPVTTPYTASYPLEVVQFDHTRADVFVVDEVYRQPISRPWLTLGIDIFSRMIVGYYLTLEAPSILSIALGLTHAVLPKDNWLAERKIEQKWPAQGLPIHIHLDNGKEFHSEAFRRGCREHGIEVIYRPIATPHWGGHIARLIGTMMGEVHLLPGTTFSNPAEKGEYDPEKHAVMTLAEFDRWFALAVTVYNRSPHSGLGGQTPQQVWEEGIAIHPVRMPSSPEEFYFDFLPFEMRLIRRDGIRLNKIQYWDDVLSALPCPKFCTSNSVSVAQQ